MRFIWLFLLIFSSAASAQESFRLTVENFGTREKPKALFDAIGLELEFEEDIVVSPADAFTDALESPLVNASEEEISSALIESGQDILLRTVFLESDTDAVILLHRALDGKVIFASRFDVDYAVVEARSAVVDQLLVALRNASLREPTSSARLRELGVGESRAIVETQKDKAKDERKDSKDARSPNDKKKRLQTPNEGDKSTELGRVALSLAPTFWGYEACTKQGDATYFFCTPKADEDTSTATGINGLIGFDLAASYRFLPFLGVDVQASYYRSNVTVTGFDPTSFSLQAGEANVALFSHTPLGKAEAFHVGGRLGGQVQSISTEDHDYIDPITNLGQDRTIIPSSLLWGALVGVNFGGGFSERLWFDLILDANIASYSENNDQIWNETQSPLALGVSATATVDFVIVAGLCVTAGVRAAAFSAKGSGPGTRLTLSGGTLFEDGMVVSARVVPKAGLAWRF